MSDYVPAEETNFLIIGAKTYLDADDAMAEFRRKIQERIRSHVAKRMQDLNKKCGMTWTSNDLKDYAEWDRGKNCFWLGSRIPIANLGDLYFYLKIFRQDSSLSFATQVYLELSSKTTPPALLERWHAATERGAKGKDLWFERPLSSADSIPRLLDHLDGALDDFMNFIESAGGLKKFMPPVISQLP